MFVFRCMMRHWQSTAAAKKEQQHVSLQRHLTANLPRGTMLRSAITVLAAACSLDTAAAQVRPAVPAERMAPHQTAHAHRRGGAAQNLARASPSRPSRQTAHGERTAAPAGAPRLPPFRACHIDISPLSAGCPAAEAARASGRLGCRWGPPCPALLPTPLLAAGPYAGANTTLPTKPPWHPSAVFC